jgi:hypothetical protein
MYLFDFVPNTGDIFFTVNEVVNVDITYKRIK